MGWTDGLELDRNVSGCQVKSGVVVSAAVAGLAGGSFGICWVSLKRYKAFNRIE